MYSIRLSAGKCKRSIILKAYSFRQAPCGLKHLPQFARATRHTSRVSANSDTLDLTDDAPGRFKHFQFKPSQGHELLDCSLHTWPIPIVSHDANTGESVEGRRDIRQHSFIGMVGVNVDQVGLQAGVGDLPKPLY